MDLVIRNGLVVDGSGEPPFEADVAVRDGRITAVGPNLPRGAEEIDARGRIVTPGFVDIHTHYDGQIIWSDRLMPSSAHGVTTVVTGNCGVGFAPCRSADRDDLICLMAGVEDIPEVVMADGLDWSWESYPEYLDAVANRPHDIDIASMIPHSALRVYVMGQRAIDREAATSADIAQMAQLTREAIRAGSLGFASSRAIQQKSSKGESIPTVRAAEDELMGIATALRDEGAGVLQFLSDFYLFSDVPGEFAMLRRLAAAAGRPVSFSVQQKHGDPDGWRKLLALTRDAADSGLEFKAQVAVRPSGVLFGHRLSLTPFVDCESFAPLARLPFEEKVARLRDPELRARLIAEAADPARNARDSLVDYSRMFRFSDRPNYEPPADESIAAIAGRAGLRPEEVAYDALLENNGETILFAASQNYADYTMSASAEMLRDPHSVIGLGDGGAHLGLICDASYPTTVLAHWTRDRAGERFSLEWAVKALAADTAAAVGLHDRGLLRPGYKADINVIDYERLYLKKPRVVHDLPAGGRRVLQDAEGYDATIVNGVIVYRDGAATGALPGQLVRGGQRSPLDA